MKFHFLILIILIIPIPNPSSAESQPTIVFLGDSNTASHVEINGSYVDHLADFGSPWTNMSIVNSGVDGMQVNILAQSKVLTDLVENHNPDYVMINLGGNDFLFGFSSNSFISNYQNLINKILYEDTDKSIKQIILTNIYWGTLEIPEERQEVYKEFQKGIEDLADANQFTFVDIFALTENHSEYYQEDGIHLNQLGHQKLSVLINKTLSPLLNSYPTQYISTWPTALAGRSSTSTTEESLLTASWFLIIASTALLLLKKKRLHR